MAFAVLTLVNATPSISIQGYITITFRHTFDR